MAHPMQQNLLEKTDKHGKNRSQASRRAAINAERWSPGQRNVSKVYRRFQRLEIVIRNDYASKSILSASNTPKDLMGGWGNPAIPPNMRKTSVAKSTE